MFIKSKFLTGDVKVTAISAQEDSIRVTGSIKDLYPIEVDLRGEDLVAIISQSMNAQLLLKTLSISLDSFINNK